MAHRNVHVYDVRRLDEPKQKRESALKFMTRSVACMADGKGTSGITVHMTRNSLIDRLTL